MPAKLDHIGIATSDLETAIQFYTDVLGFPPFAREKIEQQATEAVFFDTEKGSIELIAPLDGLGPVQKFLDTRGEGMHHIAFLVDNIEQEAIRLRGLGYQTIGDKAKIGARGKMVLFLKPSSNTGKVLIELCQKEKALNEY
jgi:methylmalonyl-CoA/ethylmalonyl-CoA epimerase